MIEIEQKITSKSRITDVDFNNIPFGKIFADHMFEVDYRNGEWTNPKISPYGNLSLSPALSCMHYGQAVFEGMKATKNEQGEIVLFRHLENWKRLNISAQRLRMPELPEEIFTQALTQWLQLDHNWIPEVEGGALYIRPLMIATDDYLGVKPSETYKFLIYGCPVTSYYSSALKIKVEEYYVRACVGGVGEAKAAGNYAAAMYPASVAQSEGFHQLLWTDSLTHEYIEELGTSNFFAVIDNVLYTPETDGTILRGITRDSIIKVAKHLGIEVIEERLSTAFLLESYQKGKFHEAFATGTAATIAPIELIQFRETAMNLTVSPNGISQKLKAYLDEIKLGMHHEFDEWCHQILVEAVQPQG